MIVEFLDDMRRRCAFYKLAHLAPRGHRLSIRSRRPELLPQNRLGQTPVSSGDPPGPRSSSILRHGRSSHIFRGLDQKRATQLAHGLPMQRQ